MKKLSTHHIKALLTLLLGIAVALFYAFPYVSMLSFQEQYQMFLWDTDYFIQRLSVPGGLADYIAELLVQFNYVPAAGAIIMALLFMSLQRISWLVCRMTGASNSWYPFSFIPVLALWAYMGDPNVLLSFPISLIAALLFMAGWLRATHQNSISKKVQGFLFAIITPLFYWLFGTTAFIVAAFVLIDECLKGKGFWGALAVIYTGALVYLSGYALPYPYYRIFGGLNFYRYPASIPAFQIFLMGLTVLFPFLIKLIPEHLSRICISISTLVIALLAVFGIRFCYNTLANRLIEADYLVRTCQWNKLISKADKGQMTTPLEVSCVNLALSESGVLPDKLFNYYQNGAEGLFPTFTRDMLSPVSTAEIFYRLGMVNDAERYMFEAQEAIPNFRKSSRLTQRIIDCEIINGHYAVARKYLNLLSKTTFYHNWAESRLAMLGNERMIMANAEYKLLRDEREKKQDFLFSDTEMDQMLGLLFVGNMKNKMAYEYLMCYELLQRDLKKFMKYYPLGKYVSYDHIPASFQQILIGTWLQLNNNINNIPYSVDPNEVNNTLSFIRTYMTNRNSPELSQAPLVNNAWHYILLAKVQPKPKSKKNLIY